jgi:hypothetical protein
VVPTDRPRHTLTESDEIARALDLAARRWPEDRGRRSRLLMRVVRDWARTHDDDVVKHRKAITGTSGKMAGVFPPGHLDDLRDEWPE